MAQITILTTADENKTVLGVFNCKDKAIKAADKFHLETEGEEMTRTEHNNLIKFGKNEKVMIETFELNKYQN